MGWFSDNHEDSYNEFGNTHHASITHELLGGAVAFEAAKAYEDHCAANGKPDNHALAKEIFAGFAGAAADRLVETKGLDYWDEHKRKQAVEKAQRNFSETVVVRDYEGYSNDY